MSVIDDQLSRIRNGKNKIITAVNSICGSGVYSPSFDPAKGTETVDPSASIDTIVPYFSCKMMSDVNMRSTSSFQSVMFSDLLSTLQSGWGAGGTDKSDFKSAIESAMAFDKLFTHDECIIDFLWRAGVFEGDPKSSQKNWTVVGADKLATSLALYLSTNTYYSTVDFYFDSSNNRVDVCDTLDEILTYLMSHQKSGDYTMLDVNDFVSRVHELIIEHVVDSSLWVYNGGTITRLSSVDQYLYLDTHNITGSPNQHDNWYTEKIMQTSPNVRFNFSNIFRGVNAPSKYFKFGGESENIASALYRFGHALDKQTQCGQDNISKYAAYFDQYVESQSSSGTEVRGKLDAAANAFSQMGVALKNAGYISQSAANNWNFSSTDTSSNISTKIGADTTVLTTSFSAYDSSITNANTYLSAIKTQCSSHLGITIGTDGSIGSYSNAGTLINTALTNLENSLSTI